MYQVTATELQDRTEAIIDRALSEPVLVTRNGCPTVVISSSEHYKSIEELEDAVLVQQAHAGMRSGTVPKDEVIDLFKLAGIDIDPNMVVDA